MKEQFKKVYPILLPVLCIAAGTIAFVFFFCGPVAKNNYDVLAIGCVAIFLAIIDILVMVIESIKHRNKKK